MIEIPERLRCLYSATLDERDGSYVLEVPREELEQGDVESGETYRVALLSGTDSASPAQADDAQRPHSESGPDRERSPPVEVGDIRKVTIETIGDQGDGIAKIDRGYVVIVPGTRPDDEVTVEITQARENVAFAQIQNDEGSLDNTAGDDEPIPGDTLGEE